MARRDHHHVEAGIAHRARKMNDAGLVHTVVVRDQNPHAGRLQSSSMSARRALASARAAPVCSGNHPVTMYCVRSPMFTA